MIVWIASYPKSGNTWVRSFLASYYFDDEGKFNVKNLEKIQDYPNKQFFKEEVKKDEIHKHWDESQKNLCNQKKIRFLKTHNSLIKAFGNDFTQPKYTLGVIYIIRDPRNVITSLKNHNNFETYDEALQMMLNENATLSDYAHLNNHAKTNIINSWKINYQSWLSNNFYRRLTIRYEDLIADPFQTFRDIIVFVNAICRFNDGLKLNKFNNAVKSTSFEALQKLEEMGQFSENVYSVNDKKKIKFFNQGPNNDWKKNLNEELINKMNTIYKEDLIRFNYEL